MKKHISCFMFLLMGMIVWADKSVVLPAITYPHTITTTEDKLFITEPLAVYIYSLVDFSLIKKFQIKDSDDGEFRGLITLHTGPDYILINSRHKTSFFTLEGDFIKEKKKPAQDQDQMVYIPLGSHFIGSELHEEYQANFLSRFFSTLLFETGAPSSGHFFTISIFDKNFSRVKNIHSYKHPFYAGRNINPVDIRGCTYRVYRDQLFIDDENGIIQVFAAGGKFLYSIRPAYEAVKITKTQRRRYLKYWMEQLAGAYERFQDRLCFLEYFPPIRNFFVADQRIYVLTFKETEKKSELLILDIKGQLLKKVLLPLVKIDSLRPLVINRYTINNHKLYRLVRSREGQYELHITELNHIGE